MTKIKTYLRSNKIGIYIFTGLSCIIIVLGLIVSHFVNEQVKHIDYGPLIKQMELKLQQDRKELEDSIQKFNVIIDENQKSIHKLESVIKKQDKKLDALKSDYEFKNSNINSLSTDDVVRESREQLSN
jgi:peptidoglycan hydrolase CwlO-like protein